MFTLTNILLLIIVVLLVVVLWILNNTLPQRYIETEIPTPYMAMLRDNHYALTLVREQLNKSFMGSAFPLKIEISSNRNTHTPHIVLVEFVSALLEREGWVVRRDESCKPTEIIVDLPRKKF